MTDVTTTIRTRMKERGVKTEPTLMRLMMNGLLRDLEDLMQGMRDIARELPEIPTGGTCTECGNHDRWEWVEQGHVKVSHAYWIEPTDTASTNFAYAVEESADDFSDINDTAGYMECKECNAIYRRPDEVHWR